MKRKPIQEIPAAAPEQADESWTEAADPGLNVASCTDTFCSAQLFASESLGSQRFHAGGEAVKGDANKDSL